MRRVIDLTNNRFGRLLVIERAATNTRQGLARWMCRCDCGNTTTVSGRALRTGDTQSCGCLRAESHGRGFAPTHGRARTPEYRIWAAIKARCTNAKSSNYARYGGRGITLCEAWRTSFERFYADMGPRPSSRHSIERRDNNGPYSPENCEWIEQRLQQRNTRRSYRILMDGQERTLTEACAALGVTRSTVRGRLRLGWLFIDALYAPVGTRGVQKTKEGEQR